MTEHENWADWARQSAEAEIRDLRAALAQCQHDLAAVIERKEYFRQCWEVAEAALADRDRPCVWTMENGVWYTGCGHESFLLASECCPHCPRRIERQWYGEEAHP